jgi:hypothetical protein
MFKVVAEDHDYMISGYGSNRRYLTFNRFEKDLMVFVNEETNKETTVFISGFNGFLSGFNSTYMNHTRYFLTLDNTMTNGDVIDLVNNYKQSLVEGSQN